MDKLLMLSILSSSPAEISGPWSNLSVSIQNSKKEKKQLGGDDDAHNSSRKISESSSTGRSDQQQQQQKQRRFLRWPAATPRCAPELDGLNCFETFALH
uniref:Q-rich domain protein n=1 Tax=Ananas comosus TaxID=4615 RepID=Q8H287_ANACO|nr:Q-rich domain protein [Ananas comosus]